MVDDLSDVHAELRRLRDDVSRLQNARPLEKASVTDGRVRFIGGLLRVDSGGRVEIEGTLEVDGDSTITGAFTLTGPMAVQGTSTFTGRTQIDGPLDVDGEWSLNGNGDIAGNVDLQGQLTVRGTNPIRLHNEGGAATITAGGGRVRGSADGINVQAPGGGSLFAAAGAIAAAGCTYGTHQIAATATGIQILGLGAPAPAGAKPLLIDPATNRVYRGA